MKLELRSCDSKSLIKKKNDPYAYDTGMALKEKHGFTNEQDSISADINLTYTLDNFKFAENLQMIIFKI